MLINLKNMIIYVYDIEVFKFNWFVTFQCVYGKTESQKCFCNDFQGLKDFISQKNLVLCGFNNKHYDDWILMTILNAGIFDQADIKAHSDWIVKEKKDPWTFPTVQYQKKPFFSFDLRDDLDRSLSLKKIEGNIGWNIKETSLSFDLDRPLTDEEIKTVEEYNATDVKATCELLKLRRDYLESKALVGGMYGIPIEEALGYTNAGLAARVLGAKMTTRYDERDYEIPEIIDQSMIPESVLAFFNSVHDYKITDDQVFKTTLDVIYKTANGTCPATYAWGGVHGAKPQFQYEVDDEHLLLDYDVSSLYPNSMINFGYCSRSMEDQNAYKKIVERRIEAKKNGDKATASALKLVVNSTYGAMLTDFNALSDHKNGRSVCITNQLCMTELIVMLGQTCDSLDFVNINTDGIMFIIKKSDEQKAADTVSMWCAVTGFEMEREDFKRIVQKDVNNYIAITTDGEIKTKGSFVKQYDGADFKNNSLRIIDRAVVDYLVKDIPVEDTINSETNTSEFQIIYSAGESYEGVDQQIDGERYEIPQKVNRVFAAFDEKYGPIEKHKHVTERNHRDPKTHKMVPEPVEPHDEWTVFPDCPEHPYIDNENRMKIEDINKDYYITLAKHRIEMYTKPFKNTKKSKTTEVIHIMANENRNCVQKLLQARTEFSAASVKKTGVNRFAGFQYFELNDIVPVATAIFKKLGLMFLVDFKKDGDGMIAVGTIINTDKSDDTIVFTCPVPQLTTGNGQLPAGMNSVQALGSTITYMRRYMYMLALDIVEADAFDATSGQTEPPKGRPVKKQEKPAEPVKPVKHAPKAEKQEKPAEPEKPAPKVIEPELVATSIPIVPDTDINGDPIVADGAMASDEDIHNMKKVLKQIRESGEQYEDYVTATVIKLRDRPTKKEIIELQQEADEMLQKIEAEEPIPF